MAGGEITVTKVVPQMGASLIYFTGTTDASYKLDFSDYTAVNWISAVVASTLVPEPATAYTAGGDITFTTEAAIKGVALVEF